MYKNYIFDFGQVIVKFDPEYMTSVYLENENDIKTVMDVAFDRLYWDKLDSGSITDDEIKTDMKDRLPDRLYEIACKAYDNWYYNLPFIDGMRELIGELKAKGAKIFLLSDVSQGFANDYMSVPELSDFFESFDGLVFSGPLKITKPSKEIFEFLLNKYGLKAEESIFIDDKEKNVAGAKKLGIDGYVFDGDSKKLRDYLL